MSTLLTRIFTRPRAPVCARCQEGQGRRCACREATENLRRNPEPTPTSFWWAYALVLVAIAAVWRAFA